MTQDIARSLMARPALHNERATKRTSGWQLSPRRNRTNVAWWPQNDRDPALPKLLPFYWCFISCRHLDNRDPGPEWATWLHHAIETYEVPCDLVGAANERGQPIPDRLFPVFRDEDELAASAQLSERIYQALEASRFLIVICSPRVAGSS